MTRGLGGPEGPERAEMNIPALHIPGPYEENHPHAAGRHLSRDRKVAAEQPDRLTNHTRHIRG